MADYPYTPNYGNLKKLLTTIQSAGVPGKVTGRYLESLGFKSKNDRSMIAVLKFIAFIDASGSTTDYWTRYRNKAQATQILAEAVRSAYADLFTTYPDADRKDTEALRNYFSTHTTVGGVALNAIVKTFQTLCELGDFGATGAQPARQHGGASKSDTKLVDLPGVGGPVTVNINIQLQMPPTDDATIYEKFFRAMKTHLLS